MTVASALASALARHRAGDLEGARLAYRRAIALGPADIDALNGYAARDLAAGTARSASRLLARASALAPGDVRVVVNTCLAAAEIDAATPKMMARALAIAPVMPALMDLLSVAQSGERERVNWMRRAVAIDPAAERLLRLGLALARTDRRQARRILRRAVARFPADADGLNSSGSLAYDDGDITAGARSFARSLSCRPLHAAAWSNTALASHDLGRLTAATRAARRALVLEPASSEAHTNFGNASQEAVSPSSAATAHRRALVIEPGRAAFLSNLLMVLAYLPGMSAAQAKTAGAWWSRRPVSARYPARPAATRPRIGYVSTFTLASTRHLGLSAIARHDPEAVEVFAYVQARRGTPGALDLGPALRGTRDISGLSDQAAAQAIRGDCVDVLVDLAGHTPGNRLDVFARRPARVQATWIESFFTTGLASIDWFLTDGDHSPEGADQHLAEQPFRLNRPRFCYIPPADAPAPAPPPGMRNGWVRFGCFNYPPKIGDEVIAVWASIMKELPESRLRLKWWSMTEPSVAAIMRRRFQAHGIAPDRLELAGASPHHDMLAEYGDVDIALDPFPFTGGVTTCEALWMGVPVVSLRGQSIIERQSAAILGAVGADDLIASDVESYREIAVKLAADEAGRAGLRTSLRAAMACSSLTDANDMARKLEAAYGWMVEQAKEGV